MSEMIQSVVILALILITVYALYINGVGSINMMLSLRFVGAPGGKRASFSRCSGWMKRAVRLKADAACRFTLEAELTRGEMQVELLDKHNREIFRLTPENNSAVLPAEAGERYYLVFRFKSASGSYRLEWE